MAAGGCMRNVPGDAHNSHALMSHVGPRESACSTGQD